MPAFVSALACAAPFTQADLDAAHREVSGGLPGSVALGTTVTHTCKAGFSVLDNPADNSITTQCFEYDVYTENLHGTTRTAIINQTLPFCTGTQRDLTS